jgi:hypothetical protein
VTTIGGYDGVRMGDAGDGLDGGGSELGSPGAAEGFQDPAGAVRADVRGH